MAAGTAHHVHRGFRADYQRGYSEVTFQAYLDNIKARTGKTPDELKALAAEAGVYKPDMKAGELVAWLKGLGLGHGHSMAIWKVWKDQGWVHKPKKK